MKKLIAFSFLFLVFIYSSAWALDPFVTYRSLSTSGVEQVPTVPDVNYALQQGYVNTYVLTISTNKVITVPTGSKFAVFAANADIWVSVGATVAAIPSGDTTDGTGSELNPSVRYLGSETKVNVISESAAKVSIMFYK